MKSLKNYIKDYINESYLNENYLNESVWDIEDNIEDDNKELMLDSAKKFIEDNYDRIDFDYCEFIFDEKKDKYVVNYDHHADLNPNSDALTNEAFEWGTVGGSFDCSESSITSLEGAPEYVDNAFNCCRCKNLTSLEGAPKKVGCSFYCYRCPKLESLEGALVYVGVNFC